MRFKTLEEWLSWQEQLYPSVIDLGLHRVQALLKALDLERPEFPILTVGGTSLQVHVMDCSLPKFPSEVDASALPDCPVWNENEIVKKDCPVAC